MAPLTPLWLCPWQRNTLCLLPYSDAVCVNAAAMSALLMTLPRTGRLLTVRLLPWDTQVSKHTSVLMLQPALPPHPRPVRGPPTMIFASAGDVMPPSLVVPSLRTTNDDGGSYCCLACQLLSSLLISLFSRSSCRLCIALCGRSDN